MIGNPFRREGGLLKTLNLWDWFKSLSPDRQKDFKRAYSLKVVRDMRFPYKIQQLLKGNIERTPYTKRTFLGTLAQASLLEGYYDTAQWIYKEALKMEGTAYEEHLILMDLLVLYRKQGRIEDIKQICKRDIELFPAYKEELKRKNRGKLPFIPSFEIYIYILEKEGKYKEAQDLRNYMCNEGIPQGDKIGEECK